MNCKQELVKNKALLHFDLMGKCYHLESNEVVAKKLCIRIYKEQNRNIVLEGDKICYKVVIINESCFDVSDLDFKDNLDSDTHYERNSFKVNGAYKNPDLIGNELCYHIDCLKAGEELVITFEAEVH